AGRQEGRARLLGGAGHLGLREVAGAAGRRSLRALPGPRAGRT
ncbi:MAG: Argininosuccinate synthase, partial [uncultured Rubrobacteraceae bacterium]